MEVLVMTTKNIIIVICIVVAIVLFLSTCGNEGLALYKSFKNNSAIKAENAKLKDAEEGYKNTIENNIEVIDSLSKDRDALAKKLTKLKVQREAIKNPESINEINDRLKMLGLNPRVMKCQENN
jgi:hypothetical protein